MTSWTVTRFATREGGGYTQLDTQTFPSRAAAAAALPKAIRIVRDPVDQAYNVIGAIGAKP